MRATGLEPARRWRKILNLMRLPIPPCPHGLSIAYPAGKCKKFLNCVALLVFVVSRYDPRRRKKNKDLVGKGLGSLGTEP